VYKFHHADLKKTIPEMKFAYVLFQMHASVSLWLDACPSVLYSAPLHDTYRNQHMISNKYWMPY
jgi:hypothetical protein